MNFKKPEFWDDSGLSFWSIILYPFSLLFLFVSSILKILKVEKKFPIPIICIGNIYIGGTGKTPLAKEIFQITKSLGKNPAFVKKYYSYLDDEIDMLQKTGKTFFLKKRKDSIEALIKKDNLEKVVVHLPDDTGNMRGFFFKEQYLYALEKILPLQNVSCMTMSEKALIDENLFKEIQKSHLKEEILKKLPKNIFKGWRRAGSLNTDFVKLFFNLLEPLNANPNNLTLLSKKGILTSTEFDIDALSHLFKKN